MDSKSIECFITLYRLHNMHKAADSLYISQQGLSRVIQNLEREFEVQLFDRRKTGMFPTKAGDIFYQYAVKFYSETARLKRELYSVSTGKEEIRLACAYGSLHILYPYIRSFMKDFPEYQIKWTEYTDVETERQLQEDSADLAFCVKKDESVEFETYPLFSKNVMVLVYEDHPLWNKKEISFQDLQNEKIILEGPEFHIFSSFQKKCLDAGFYPEIAAQTTEINLCHKLCRMKEGLGITIDFIAQMHQIPQVKAIPFKDPAFTWEVYMAVKKRESLPKGAEAFWKYLTALF